MHLEIVYVYCCLGRAEVTQDRSYKTGLARGIFKINENGYVGGCAEILSVLVYS